MVSEGTSLNEETRCIAKFFNQYFGSDMSSLVFQEIREFRSLAYSAWGSFRIPFRLNEQGYTYSSLSTQSDKTYNALEAFDTLLNFMPEKPERMENIRSSLIQSLSTSRPTFRGVSSTVSYWLKQGYIEDPRRKQLEYYKNITFDDIMSFYRAQVKGKPLLITISGETKRMNLEKLNKFGKVVDVKKDKIFTQ